ncbi:MAG: hypothetical protein MRZ79_05690 [Bacteroidia bacterium]|nr:hypothetical protein [Bacteroidia bacterium]
MGSLKSIDLFPTEQSDCGGCSSKWKCCDFTHISGRLSTEHQASTTLSIKAPLETMVPVEAVKETSYTLHKNRPQYFIRRKAPPSKIPAFLLNSSFIFYG